MEADPTLMCELLVGMGDVEVPGVDDREGERLRAHPQDGAETGL